MVHRGTKIPTLYSMGFPRASHSWIFMDDELCTRRGDRRGVVVEISIQLCIPETFWVHARFSEKFEIENGVWDKLAPEMKPEVLVSTGKSRYEVILEIPNCSFC